MMDRNNLKRHTVNDGCSNILADSVHNLFYNSWGKFFDLIDSRQIKGLIYGYVRDNEKSELILACGHHDKFRKKLMMELDYHSFDATRSNISHTDVKSHTQAPTCTGTSVIGIKFADGVVIAADTLISYGSLARYTEFERVYKVNERTVMASSGDAADFQLLKQKVSEKTHVEDLLSDGFKMSPQALHCWLTRVLYNRRSQLNPLWNTYIVAGIENQNVPFLGYCNMLGVSYTEDCVASGYGSFLAIPLLRKRLDSLADGDAKKLSQEDAIQAITDAMRQLYYRDCRAFNKYQMAVVRPEGIQVSGPITLNTNWSVAEYVAGYQ